jgi:hypothetical protein
LYPLAAYRTAHEQENKKQKCAASAANEDAAPLHSLTVHHASQEATMKKTRDGHDAIARRHSLGALGSHD